MKIWISIISYLLVFCVIYVIGATMVWEWDVSVWSIGGRCTWVVVSFVIASIINLIKYLPLPTIKN